MADVFLSYARRDRDKAELVKQALESIGVSVFFDVDGLDGGDVFPDVLDKEVKSAGAIVSLWSPWSLSRPWVKQECSIGLKRRVLIPAVIEPLGDLDVPVAFEGLHQVNITDFHGDARDPNWLALRRALARTLKRPEIGPPARVAPVAAPKPAPPPSAAHPRSGSRFPLLLAGAGILATVAAAIVFLADPLGWRTPAQPAPPPLTTAAAQPAETPASSPVEPAPSPVSSPPTLTLPSAATDPAVPPEPAPTYRLPQERLIKGQGGSRGSVYFPDGQSVATIAEKKIVIWNPKTGTVIRTLAEAGGTIHSLAISRSGTQILTATEDGNARFWDVGTGAETWRFTLPASYTYGTEATLSPDGRLVAIGGPGKEVHLVDVASRQIVHTLSGHSEKITTFAFSPDSTRIATASVDNTVRIWDVATGNTQRTISPYPEIKPSISNHSYLVQSVAFSPDGKRLLTGSNDDTASVWNLATGARLAWLKDHSSTVYDGAWSPDGKRFATASADGQARLWDATSYRSLAATEKVSYQAQTVSSVAFSPDGKRIVTSISDGSARTWRIEEP